MIGKETENVEAEVQISHEKVIGNILQQLARLKNSDGLPIEIVQADRDPNLPVFLSEADSKNKSKVARISSLLTLDELGSCLVKHLKHEKTQRDQSASSINQVRESFSQLRQQILSLISKVENACCQKLFCPFDFSSFLTDFQNGVFLHNSSGLLLKMEKTIRNLQMSFSSNELLLYKEIREKAQDVCSMTEEFFKSSFQGLLDFLEASRSIDSKIINREEAGLISSWVSQTNHFKSKNVNLHLIHRGTRDGFSSSSFHQNCDNKGPTVVVAQTSLGKKIGGFAQKSWQSSGGSNNISLDFDEETT